MIGLSTIDRLLARNGRLGTMAKVVLLRALALGVNVGTGFLTAAVLGPSGRGEQAALILAPLFLGSVSTLGLHASLIYNLKNDPENAGSYFGTALAIAFAAGVVATVVGWVVVPYWLVQYDHHVVEIARWLLLITPLLVISPLLTGVLEAHGQFGLANRTLYLQSLGTLAGLAVLWLTGVLSPVSAAIVYLVPTIPAALYFSRHIGRLLHPRLSRQRHIAKALLHYGLRFYGVDLLGSLSGYLDQIVVVALLAPGTVGTYVVALSLSRVLTVLQGAVTTVLFPSIAARPRDGVVETVAFTARMTSIVSIVAAIALAIVGPPLIHLGYGKSFAGSIAPFRILLVETVVSNAARILYQAFSATGRPGVVTMFEAIGVSVSAGSMLLIVPSYGAVGAAACVLLASSVRLCCAIIGMPLILRVRMPRLIVARSDLQWVIGR